MKPVPKPGILDITAYVGGRAAVPGVTKVFKLSSNESPLGPSPKALAALDEARGQLALYPEGSAAILREAIAEVYKLDPALFAPAEVWVSNLDSGRTWHAGALDMGLLRRLWVEQA